MSRWSHMHHAPATHASMPWLHANDVSRIQPTWIMPWSHARQGRGSKI
jgi:hypothetical protein